MRAPEPKLLRSPTMPDLSNRLSEKQTPPEILDVAQKVGAVTHCGHRRKLSNQPKLRA